MAYVQIPTRTTASVNSSADVNQLQDNLDAIGGGGASAPSRTVKQIVDGTQSTGALSATNKVLDTDAIDDTPADDADTAVSSKWIYDNIYKAFKAFTSVTKAVDYSILDNDGYETIYNGSTDNSRTNTLPTAADNTDRILTFLNLNPYAYDGGSDNSRTVTIDGEGGETLDYAGIQQTTIVLERYGCGIKIKSNGTSWDIIEVINATIESISGTLEMIYTKYVLDTTDADAETLIPHGVDFDKILHCWGMIKSATIYFVYDEQSAVDAANGYLIIIDATNIRLNTVGANLQGKLYRVRFEYYI